VITKKTCRPACPISGAWWECEAQLPRKTVKSITLPTMPIGQAQTRRRMPPTAEASPKRLPKISR
jgi:hypothetical protein